MATNIGFVSIALSSPLGVSQSLEFASDDRHIHKPLPAAQFDYAPYQVAIAALKKNPACVGIALARKVDGSAYPVFLSKYAASPMPGLYFSVQDIGSEEPLGVAHILQLATGSGSEVVQKVFISVLRNARTDSFKDIGTLLMKCIFQEFLDLKIRVEVEATGNSGPFYYKLGYRIDKERQRHLEKAFAEIAKGGKISEEKFEPCVMYLPDEARRIWAREIRESRIRLPLFPDE